MLNKAQLDYDATTKTLRYRAKLGGKRLLAKHDGELLASIAEAKSFEGKPVRRVVVRFNDEAAAHYNADPLKFLGLESESPRGVARSDARFTVRDDFGIDEG